MPRMPFEYSANCTTTTVGPNGGMAAVVAVSLLTAELPGQSEAKKRHRQQQPERHNEMPRSCSFLPVRLVGSEMELAQIQFGLAAPYFRAWAATNAIALL